MTEPTERQVNGLAALRIVLAEVFGIDMDLYEDKATVNYHYGEATFFRKGKDAREDRPRVKVIGIVWNSCVANCVQSHGESDLYDIGQIKLEFNHSNYWKACRTKRNRPTINLHFDGGPHKWLADRCSPTQQEAFKQIASGKGHKVFSLKTLNRLVESRLISEDMTLTEMGSDLFNQLRKKE